MSDRERLTITLKKSILSRIDDMIDGTKIRNRSHAIETAITKGMSGNIHQAVVLTGGKGLNMRPFTYEMPKGLFPVSGKPILVHILDLLKKNNITDVIFSIGHLGDRIKEYFHDGKKFGVNITYVWEKESLGTAGALVHAEKFIKSSPFIVVHGDILIDFKLMDMINFHHQNQSIGTIAVTSVIDPSSFGEITLQGSKIANFVEKPKKGRQKSQIINCGLYIFDGKIFSLLPDRGFAQMEEQFPKIIKSGQLAGFPFEGKFMDIGNPASYEKAIKEWNK